MTRELSSRAKMIIAILSTLLLVGAGIAYMRYEKANEMRLMEKTLNEPSGEAK